MFSNSGLFNKIPCPEKQDCKRVPCIFSHDADTRYSIPHIPVLQSSSLSEAGPSRLSHGSPTSQTNSSSLRNAAGSVIPSKRPVPPPAASRPLKPQRTMTVSRSANDEPPKKIQRLDASSSKVKSSPNQQAVGMPVLRVNPASSQVAVPVRQAMLKSLYEGFVNLYSEILSENPSLASDHALAQEQEVYEKSTKLTYRNAVISSIASLKKRPKPTSAGHESVGTEEMIQKRKEESEKLRSLKVSGKHLTPLVMTIETMKTLEYITEIPEGPGGTNPSEEGKFKQCERCNKQFIVRRKGEAEECVFHWGRLYTKKVNGEKLRVYSCCSQSASDSEGCNRGPHVFSEYDVKDLHSRHAFSPSRPVTGETEDTALDVIALDCEMIYTTGGMRVARVSAVDGSGRQIMDELVRMDEGVEVIDFNTRFSGVTEEDYEKAVLPLASIRRTLDSFLNSETILVGHALENDLKTLRLIHLRCVDTVVLFPHRLGFPYRRALRDLVREHLGRTIQTGGGTSGHSSLEDAIATLDLVRWHILNKGTTS